MPTQMIAAAAAATSGAGNSISLLGNVQPSWLLAAGALVAMMVMIPPLVWLQRRWDVAITAQKRTREVADRLAEMLAVTPDGYYAWHYRSSGRSSGEVCSRRLAVVLGLYGGTASSFEDVLDALAHESAVRLQQAANYLRLDGSAFEIELSLDHTERRILAIGIRAAGDDGTAMADMIWMRDVTDAGLELETLVREVATVRADRDRVRALLDALPVPVWLRDDTLSLTFCNQAYAKAAAAASPEEALSEGRELAPRAAGRHGRALAALARATGEARTETSHLVIAGERRLMAVTEIPLETTATNNDGRSTLGIALDMSRLEDVEVVLSRHLAAQANVLEQLATAIAIFGADTHLTYHNTAFTRLWHLDEDWLTAGPSYSTFLEMLRDRRSLPEVADYPAFKRQELARFTSLIYPIEDLMHLPNGVTLRRVLSPHPLGGLQATYEDVTDTLVLERSYNTLIAVQRETLDHLNEAVAVFGADGRLRLSNPAYGTLWNHSPKELADEPRLGDLLECYRPFFADVQDWPAFKAEMLGLMTDRTPRNGRIARSDGSILSYASYPLPDGGELLTYQDISDSAKVERALLDRNESLRAANRLRTQFINNISTEVRGPLTTLGGYAEILLGGFFGELNERQLSYANQIMDTSRSLATLIDDIVDLASIEAGELSLTLDAFDITSLLTPVTTLTRERIREQDISLAFDCPDDIGWMIGDLRRLKQVLFTLVSNAIKFTPTGGQVSLAARREGGNIVFTVADTGIGMPEADQARTLASLSDDRRSDTNNPSTGLGLSLVKRFVELHDGSLTLDSVAAVGTTVTCRIPAGGQDEETAP